MVWLVVFCYVFVTLAEGNNMMHHGSDVNHNEEGNMEPQHAALEDDLGDDLSLGDVFPISPPTVTPTAEEGPGNFGVFDPSPYPTVDEYPSSRVVRVGDFVEFDCTASDHADHLVGLPNHDLHVDILYEADPTRDFNSVEHSWFKDRVNYLKRRPSAVTGRIDITETASVNMLKMGVSLEDEGWYVCQACIQKGKPAEICDNDNARFYLRILDENESALDDDVAPLEDLTTKDNPRVACQVFGNSHVLSYDGFSYDLPSSSCDYVLAMDAAHYSWFVYGRNRPCGKDKPGMCLESITLYWGREIVELQRGWLVNYKGAKYETLYLAEALQLGPFQVTFFDSQVEVALVVGEEDIDGITYQDSIHISWDGYASAHIHTPNDTPTWGLCGDNDADPSNDLDVWGLPNQDTVRLGESYKVDSRGVCAAPLISDPTEECTGARQRCEEVFSAGVFEGCPHDTQLWIDACIADECGGLDLPNGLYEQFSYNDVDEVLPPRCVVGQAYAARCSRDQWFNGIFLPKELVTGWEYEAGCPTESAKSQIIPRMGCPQSFMVIWPYARNV